VGDAGVGKTRFASEAMARAAAGGMVMVRGECLPLAEAVPLLPVAGAVGELARVDDGGLAAAALDAVWSAPGFVETRFSRLVVLVLLGGLPPLLVIRCRTGAGCQGAASSPSGYRSV